MRPSWAFSSHFLNSIWLDDGSQCPFRSTLCCDTLLAVETTSGVSCILETGENRSINRTNGNLDFNPFMQKTILTHQPLRAAESDIRRWMWRLWRLHIVPLHSRIRLQPFRIDLDFDPVQKVERYLSMFRTSMSLNPFFLVSRSACFMFEYCNLQSRQDQRRQQYDTIIR